MEMPDCVAEQRKYDKFRVSGGTHPEKIAEKYKMLKDEEALFWLYYKILK